MQFVFLRHIVAFLGSALLVWYLVPIMIVAAKKWRILDVPDFNLKKHEQPTPYLGGIAVYFAFISMLALTFPFEGRLLWFILGTTLLLFAGLIDDLKVLVPWQKLFAQVIAVLCFLKGGFALKTRFFSDFINIAASGFWMLSVINAFNLVDVMDGLSSLLAIISGLAFFVIAILVQAYSLSLLLITLLGALIAFLFYNRPPARIYLGDAGALFVGGFIAAIPLLIHWTEILSGTGAIPFFAKGNLFLEIIVSALIPIVIVGIPLLEVVSLIVIRKASGLPFYFGSPHHFSLYLKSKGWGIFKILFFSGSMAIFLSSVSILFMFGFLSFYYFVITLFIFLCVWIYSVFYL